MYTDRVTGKINAFFCSVKTCRSKCHVETHGHVAFLKIYEFFLIQGYVRQQVNQVCTVLFYNKTWRSSCVVYEIVLIIIVIINMTYSNKERVYLHEKYGWLKCVLNNNNVQPMGNYMENRRCKNKTKTHENKNHNKK